MLFYYKIISKYIFFILTNINMYVIVFYIRQAKTYPGNKGMDDKKIATVFKALCDENRTAKNAHANYSRKSMSRNQPSRTI